MNQDHSEDQKNQEDHSNKIHLSVTVLIEKLLNRNFKNVMSDTQEYIEKMRQREFIFTSDEIVLLAVYNYRIDDLKQMSNFIMHKLFPERRFEEFLQLYWELFERLMKEKKNTCDIIIKRTRDNVALINKFKVGETSDERSFRAVKRARIAEEEIVQVKVRKTRRRFEKDSSDKGTDADQEN